MTGGVKGGLRIAKALCDVVVSDIRREVSRENKK